jgi:hypothetical protein
MALVTQMTFGEKETPDDILMVTHAVGANAANFHSDIQLAQYMIGKIYLFKNEGAGEWGRPMTPSELANLPNPFTDFKALKKTTELIRRFQQDCVKQGLTVFVDGRIDRAFATTSSISKTQYTILIANFFLESAISDSQGTDDFITFVENDTDLPDLVKGELKASDPEPK